MNHKIIIATTITVIGLSSCRAQQRQMFDNVNDRDVNHRPTVVSSLPRNEATVTVVDIGTPVGPKISANPQCGESGGVDCPQNPTPPTTVYTGPAQQQCEDGSFAPQGECPAPVEQVPTTTEPEFVQCWDGAYQQSDTCQIP